MSLETTAENSYGRRCSRDVAWQFVQTRGRRLEKLGRQQSTTLHDGRSTTMTMTLNESDLEPRGIVVIYLIISYCSLYTLR